MKKVYLMMLLNVTFINLHAQNFDWAIREGLNAYDYGYGVSTDVSGNVYVAGKYEENANFSGTILPNTSSNHDMFVAKYSSAGALTWIQTCGGTLGDYAHAMACDHTNYVYVAGEIEGTNEHITFPGSSISLTAINDNDIFLAKYDLAGTLLWARSAGGYGGEKALGVTYDGAGNVYICGQYKDTVTFGGTTTIYNSGAAGTEDLFIAKYDASGTFQWVRHAGGPGREEGLSIQATAAGDIYMCGMYSDGALFGSTVLTTPVTPTGHYLNAFLAKYAADGSLAWVKTGGGDYDDVAWSLTLDNAGKIYVAGEFNAYALFGTNALTTSGNADAFVTAYDAAGNVLWASKAGGALIDRARGIGTDGTNLFITGQFGSTGIFGTTTLTAADSSDIFMAGLNNSGTFQWAKSVSGPADGPEYLGYESGNGICANGTNVYATGALLDGGTFGSLPALMPYSRTDMFLTRMNALVGINESTAEHFIPVYPNPGKGNFVIDMSDVKGQHLEMTIYNYLGEVVEKNTPPASSSYNLDLSSREKGIYFVELKADNIVYREKIVLQ